MVDRVRDAVAVGIGVRVDTDRRGERVIADAAFGALGLHVAAIAERATFAPRRRSASQKRREQEVARHLISVSDS